MKILILVAHADDETLGVGGWIPKLIKSGHEILVVLASDGNIKARGNDIKNFPAFKTACSFFNISKFECLGLEDQFLDKYPIAEIANQVAKVAENPDVIISHVSSDLNKDHRIMCDVAKIIGRPKHKPISILGMEIANTSSWNGNPFLANLYIDISDTIELKKKAFSIYTNEISDFPYPYSIKGIEVLAQFRGMEAGCLFAEAFQIIRCHHNLLVLS